MATDGEIDYRCFTPAQLEEALARTDRARFPNNFQRLLDEIERRKAEAAAAASAVEAVRYRPEFRADPREYFRIWIVNLCLTLLTLGVYSAWAKVRKLRYFYSSTLLAGSAFGYHADPVKILRGRIIAAALAGSYFLASRTSRVALLGVLAFVSLITPYLVVKSRMFALRVTSWRGLRFDFDADYRGAYRELLGWLIVGLVTFGLMMPRFVRERYRFIVTRSRYGGTAFDCNPSINRFYATAFGAIGLVFALTLGLAVPLGLLAEALAQKWPASRQVMTVSTTFVLYALMFCVVRGYTQARNLNEVFGNTSLGPHRVRSDLKATRLIGLYLGNLFAMVVTLGLYTPWAQVRLARYRLEALELELHGSLDELAAGAGAPVPAATGEEISSLLDVDFGF